MKYTEDHLWLRIDDDLVVVGMTEQGVDALGDVVFVELPEVESMMMAGDEVGVIESIRTAADIVAPLDGEIVAVNQKLIENPALVNQDPLGVAWFFKIQVDDLSVLDDLLDEDEYADAIG